MIQIMDSIMMDVVNNMTKEKLLAGGFFKNNIDESYERILPMYEGVDKTGWQESLHGVFKWTNESCIETIQKVKAPIIAINSDMQPTNVEAWNKYHSNYKANIVKDVGMSNQNNTTNNNNTTNCISPRHKRSVQYGRHIGNHFNTHKYG